MNDLEDQICVDTARLAYFAVYHILGDSQNTVSSSRTSRVETCLRSCVLKMLERHEIVFNGMMSRLKIDRSVDLRQGISETAQELFKDDISWSKIVALFAYGARLGQYCRDNDLHDLVENIAENLADFANDRLTPFVRAEGGWVSRNNLICLLIKCSCCR